MTVGEYLFVYGSLRPALAPPGLRQLVQQWHRIGAAFVQGRLYDLGDYPGAILDAESELQIIGEIFELPDDETVLATLDQYEGFDCDNHDASLFVRTKCHVLLGDVRKVECWIYVYNRETTSAKLIVNGDYLWKHKQK
ncbi:MAG: gamma-glutamylcyclotransferase [Acidobacteria bacterium]|nr:gamma-glutamylcyclotransferase [Acidobacteriota bacterium]